MIGRPFRMEWHEEDTPAALKRTYLSQRDVSIRTRLHVLWLIRCDWQIKAASEAVGVHYRSAQRWVEWYREGGLNEVVSRKMGGVGQPRYLNSEQERKLKEEVDGGRFRTAGEIADWVESEYGVRFKGNSIYSLLQRLGCSPKVPRPRHEKANMKAQKSWKKGAREFPSESGSEFGNADWVCRRDERGASWYDAPGVGSSWGEGGTAIAVGV